MKTNLFKSFLLMVLLLAGASNASADPVTVNGRPATKQEKAVAAKMVKQGVQMAKKGAHMAASAVTNPSKVDQIEQELETMGDEMERLGDSLEKMADDTTFLYSAADSLELEGDSLVLAGDEDDDFSVGLETLGMDVPQWMHTWWGQIIGGGIGMLAVFFALFILLIVFVFLFAFFTAPLWITAIVIWLLVRNTNSSSSNDYLNYQTPHDGVRNEGAPNTEPTVGNTDASAQQFSGANAAPSASDNIQNQSPERSPLWQSGVMYACIGVGLAIFFYVIGFTRLWGLGALVACIGVAKLVIAYSQNKH